MVAASPACPLVSVVMANYRGALHLPHALNSVLGQTVQDIEVIVADDASPDESGDVVRRFAQRDHRVSLIESVDNLGPAAARNRALQAARGEWIAIVDSDDIIHPERFETLLAVASALDADAVADDLLFFSETAEASGTTLLGRAFSRGTQRVSAEYFVRCNTFGADLPMLGYLKPMFRRARITDLSYNEGLRVAEDFDFLLRFLLRDRSLFVVPEPLYLYRRHAASISHRLSEAKVLGMIAGHEALVEGHGAMSSELRDLLDVRMEALHRALRFERLVSAIKRRGSADTLRLLADDPRLAVPLARSAMAHLRAARHKQPPRSNRRSTLILGEEGTMPARAQALHGQLCGDTEAEMITVPPYRHPSERASFDRASAALWARLVERSMAEDLQIVGQGLAGIHAMAFLPRTTQATAVVDDTREFERALDCISGTSARLVVSETVLASTGLAQKTRPLAAGYHLVESDPEPSAPRVKAAGTADAR